VSKTPKPKPTLIRSTEDFARHVGLARTTVSRVLNGQPGLKQKTIDRVQRALAETGFTPNAHALHLKGKRTAMIGICMENLLTPPVVRKLAALQRLLRDRGFSSLIEVFTPGTGREVVRHFLSMRVEAVVFIGHFHREETEARIAELITHGTPHLVIDHSGLHNANTISLDRAAAMKAVVNHLLDHGHRSFGLLGISKALPSHFDRMAGIDAALRARRLDFETSTLSLDHRHERRNDFDFGYKLAANFLEQPHRPTALLAINDEVAIGALRGLQDAGAKVPRDMSVTGFNNQDICLMTSPTLTTVDQNIAGTIGTVAEVLFAQLDAPLKPRLKPIIRMITPSLVVRDSTGPARV
jgi:DNA-binding LacI/PurR family transcriptional regulator